MLSTEPVHAAHNFDVSNLTLLILGCHLEVNFAKWKPFSHTTDVISFHPHLLLMNLSNNIGK
jgi:hypothetical protein